MEEPSLGQVSPPEGDMAQQQRSADAQYQQSLQHFQNGQWQKAIQGFEGVLQLSPDHVEARAFLEEARLKASLDHVKPRRPGFRLEGPIRYLLLTALIVIAALAIGAGVRYVYGRWIEPQQLAQKAQAQLNRLLEQAQQQLAERDYGAAERSFQAILNEDPDNSEAQKGLAEAQQKGLLDKDYTLAQEAIARQDWETALLYLAKVVAQDPGFRDAAELQGRVRQQQELSKAFVAAESAYAAGDCEGAISGYEAMRTLDAEYEKGAVSAHLIDCYLRQASYLIESSKGSDSPVQQARAMYERVLVLQPTHPDAAEELALCAKYLEGQALLAQGDTEGAVLALQWVCEQRADYAGGNACTLLGQAGGGTAAAPGDVEPLPLPGSEGSFEQEYATWMQQGDAALKANECAQAEDLYRKAALIAVHGGYNSAKWLFAVYVKLASVSARCGQPDQAVGHVQTAIQLITKSAVAIPEESYRDFLDEGDRYAQAGDYTQALAQYDQAVHVFGQKCACGLEDWSILP